MNDLVTYESREEIAIVTINRAERMNALNEGVIQGLRGRLAAVRRLQRSRRDPSRGG